MKSRKEDYSRQEILGHFVTSAAVWKIINGITLEQKPGNAYEYKLNIKMATYLVKKFLATPGASGEQLIKDMSRYLVQVKPDRAMSAICARPHLCHSTIASHNHQISIVRSSRQAQLAGNIF